MIKEKESIWNKEKGWEKKAFEANSQKFAMEFQEKIGSSE